MMVRRQLLIASLACWICLPGCVNVIVHNEKAAASAATQFAEAAFVKRDAAAAHALLSKATQQAVPMAAFTEGLAKMHPKASPTEVTATEFEPMPGQRGMMIYLHGTGSGEDFYYRLVMEGDASAGYRVGGFFRGNGPHPSTGKRPLGR